MDDTCIGSLGMFCWVVIPACASRTAGSPEVQEIGRVSTGTLRTNLAKQLLGHTTCGWALS
jgi:hypothetical protein